jgi:hypothetical protein
MSVARDVLGKRRHAFARGSRSECGISLAGNADADEASIAAIKVGTLH